MEQRSEHLKWCKQRAMEYCNMGDTQQAFNSFISDLGKFDKNPKEWSVVTELGMMLLIGGQLSTQSQMKHFIEGTN